jgi:hypothetical protein
MKRLVIITLLLLGNNAVIAQTVNEIPCWLMGADRKDSSWPDHRLIAIHGQGVTGYSHSANHSILHGFTGCVVTPTGMDGNSFASAPSVYALHQNVPNPFNPRTVIRYDIPANPCEVAIKIYDVSGRHVRTLVERVESAGRHEVVWDGTDDAGRSVASGLYIVMLETPEGRFPKKMALLR